MGGRVLQDRRPSDIGDDSGSTSLTAANKPVAYLLDGLRIVTPSRLMC
jgi:hypothetical protein